MSSTSMSSALLVSSSSQGTGRAAMSVAGRRARSRPVRPAACGIGYLVESDAVLDGVLRDPVVRGSCPDRSRSDARIQGVVSSREYGPFAGDTKPEAATATTTPEPAPHKSGCSTSPSTVSVSVGRYSARPSYPAGSSALIATSSANSPSATSKPPAGAAVGTSSSSGGSIETKQSSVGVRPREFGRFPATPCCTTTSPVPSFHGRARADHPRAHTAFSWSDWDPFGSYGWPRAHLLWTARGHIGAGRRLTAVPAADQRDRTHHHDHTAVVPRPTRRQSCTWRTSTLRAGNG
jgi:hypothetical protein